MAHVVYFSLPAVRLDGFRAHAGAYLLGVPQPTSVAGLVYALGLALAKLPSVMLEQSPGVAYGVSEWSGFAGISLNQRQAAGTARADVATPAAIDDRARASVTLSLIIEMVLTDDSVAPEPEALVQQLEKMRLQASSLFVRAPAQRFTDLAEAIRRMPAQAFFLTDATDEMETALNEAEDTMSALMQFLGRPRDGEYKPRWVPALVGWRPLTEPRILPNVREGAMAHVTAEPVIGLARFRVKGAFRGWALDDEAPVFWRHTETHCPSQHYLVKGTTPYEPEFVF